MFQDRIDAGLALSRQLLHYKDADGIVLAIPRGGVPVAYPVAHILHLPLDIILSKKIGHPMHKEYAIGAVSLTGRILSPDTQVPQQYIDEETMLIRKNLQEMYHRYRGDAKPTDVAGKIVILIDDGVATGHTMLSTVEMIRNELPKKVVVAVPVASSQAALQLEQAADEFVSVLIPEYFRSVGEFYEVFTQVSDEEVISYLTREPNY